MQVQGSEKVYTGISQVGARETGGSACPCVSPGRCMPLIELAMSCSWVAYNVLSSTRAATPVVDIISQQGIRHMWATDGVRGLFKGNGLNCIRIIPNQAIKFMAYEQLSRKISHALIDRGGDGQLTPGLRLAAGAGAGIVGMSATYPLDMVRGRITVQQQSSADAYNGMLHATRRIVAEEGLVALWRGWLPSVIGVIPYVGLNFAVYETLKDMIIKSTGGRNEQDLAIATRLGCGAAAGTLGQTVAYPFDVVRRRLQMSGWAGAQELHAEAGHAVRYRGMTDCFVRTVREEGVSVR